MRSKPNLSDPLRNVDLQYQVDTQGTLGVGDIIILNIAQSTEETLTVAGFGSILVNEPLKYDHGAGESITLKKKVIDTTYMDSASDLLTPTTPSPNKIHTSLVHRFH